MSWTLTTPTPFSLESVLLSHGWVQMAPFAVHPQGDGFDYTLRLNAGARVVDCRVTAVEQGVRVESEADLSQAEAQELCASIEWMVGFELDLRPFYALAKNEPRLAHVEKSAKGRLLRSATLYEDLVKTILTTNTTWSGTLRMNLALVELYGEPGPRSTNAFPTPDRLAQLSPDELRVAAKVGYRAPYIVELSQAVSNGALDLETLKTPGLTTPEIRKFLLSIKGVGDYATANMLLLLGHYDFVPVDSIAVKSVGDQWHDGQRIGPKEIHAAFEGWQPYRGLAYWFWEWD